MPGVCGELTWLILLFSVPLQQEKLLTGKIASLEATKMDTLGIEPRASRMLSGCDTTTPCALYIEGLHNSVTGKIIRLIPMMPKGSCTSPHYVTKATPAQPSAIG